MMIFSGMVLGALFCTAISQVHGLDQANGNGPPAEDLLDEYYTTIFAMTDQLVPQDEKDIKAINDSGKNKTIIAGILPYREKARRYVINKNMPEGRWLSDTYAVGQNSFDDFCFALIEKESNTLGSYLRYFMKSRDKQRIGLGMVLVKDTRDMINIFKIRRDEFKHSYEGLGDPLKVSVENWSKKNRNSLEKDEVKKDSVSKDAEALDNESKNGAWKKSRKKLDNFFFQKSIKYSRAVITEFEQHYDGLAIEDFISIYGLDEGLANIYGYFARYIKNKPKFIAEILLQYSDGRDSWAVWNMCMAVIHPQEWRKVDEIFKQSNKDTSLTKFITEKNNDKIMAEMMAVIIDPSFKPTQFQPLPGKSSGPPGVPSVQP